MVDPSRPPGTNNAAGVWDPVRARLVWFGGEIGSLTTGDTWLFDGTTWTLATREGPGPRGQASMTWDPERAQVILFGGYRESGDYLNPIEYLDDTWAWDGQRWSELPIAADRRPSARVHAEMTWDPDLRAPLLFGGGTFTTPSPETWVLSSSTGWSRLDGLVQPTQVYTQESASTRDARSGEWVVYTVAADPEQESRLWNWKAGGWSYTKPEFVPRPRTGSAMAWHPLREEIIFGGYVPGIDSSDRGPSWWTWDGVDWDLLTASPSLANHRLIWIPPRNALLAVGGQGDCTGAHCQDQWWLGDGYWVHDPDSEP